MFKTELKINFFDADPAGIMFFGNLFKYAHSAYEQFFSQAGFHTNYFLSNDLVIPILHTEADYLKPILPLCNITVELTVTVLRNSSFELSYIFRSADKTTLAAVRTVHIFLDKNSWEKITIPEEVKSFLQLHYNPISINN